jgi:phosphoribosyl-ATP pyrophosphohydrolase/phosphoribosyl-AMP cyclohydrolase
MPDNPPASTEKQTGAMQDVDVTQSRGRGASPEDMAPAEFGIAINKLYDLIADRNEKRPDGSYTTYLFNSGLDKILKKIAEECGEVLIAAKNESRARIVSELADLLYHLLVLMVEQEVRLVDVQDELARRASLPAGERDREGSGSQPEVERE